MNLNIIDIQIDNKRGKRYNMPSSYPDFGKIPVSQVRKMCQQQANFENVTSNTKENNTFLDNYKLNKQLNSAVWSKDTDSTSRNNEQFETEDLIEKFLSFTIEIQN